MISKYRHVVISLLALSVALVFTSSISAQAAVMPMKGVTRCVLNPIVATYGEASNAYDAAAKEKLRTYLTEQMSAAVTKAGLTVSNEQWRPGFEYPSSTVVMNLELDITADNRGVMFGDMAQVNVWRWLKTELSSDAPTMVCSYSGTYYNFADSAQFGARIVSDIDLVLREFVNQMPTWQR